MSSPTNPCARQIEFAGEVRTFNLNDDKVLALIAGGDAAFKADIRTFMHYAGKAPLEGQYGSTPAACLKRFIQAEYSISDIENVIALGLIGGGMSAIEAFRLVAEHVTGQPLVENAIIASEVISALFVGVDSEAA